MNTNREDQQLLTLTWPSELMAHKMIVHQGHMMLQNNYTVCSFCFVSAPVGFS